MVGSDHDRPTCQARLLEPLDYAVVKNLLTGEVLGPAAASHGGTPNQPVVMDDCDLVLKPMVTTGDP